MPVSLQDQAKARLELRARRDREALESVYDWYGVSCPCGVPIGECEIHPRARPSQRPPGTPGASSTRSDWRHWLIMAGRGFGKSIAACQYVRWRVEQGTAPRIGIVGDTITDVRQVMIEGSSGLQSVFPPWWQVLYEPSKRQVSFLDRGRLASIATIYSAEDPDGLRGPQFNLLWMDEIGKWQNNLQGTWDNAQMTLRMKTDPRPVAVLSTTPRPLPVVCALVRDHRTVVTGGSTFENRKHLAEDFIAEMQEKYSDTRIGRQELFAELLEDVPGSLWNTKLIDKHRVTKVPEHVTLRRIVVAIDPGAGSADPNTAAENGITIGGIGSDGHGYLLGDLSCKGSPSYWATQALIGYALYQADLIVGEKNQGGDMVESVIKSVPSSPSGVHPGGASVPYKAVWASRGKTTRAEPISTLYEQGKIHHVGMFMDMERQMCTYDPMDPEKGLKDRMDALVWLFTELMLQDQGETGVVLIGGKRPKQAYPRIQPVGMPY